MQLAQEHVNAKEAPKKPAHRSGKARRMGTDALPVRLSILQLCVRFIPNKQAASANSHDIYAFLIESKLNQVSRCVDFMLRVPKYAT
jgi:hypothetical protein